MSEEAKEYFNFGTRFPYTIKNQTEDWVKTLDERNTVVASTVYEYGENDDAYRNFDDENGNFEIYKVDADGNDSKLFPIKRILSKAEKNTVLVGWRYTQDNGEIKDGRCNYAGKSSNSKWTATNGTSNSSAIATASTMKFFEIIDNVDLSKNQINEDFDTAIKKAINELIGSDGENTPSINIESEKIREKETENLRENGEGKYLDLRVLYGYSVNQILGILSKNRKRKDLLFFRAESWKNTPISTDSDSLISNAASMFKGGDIHANVKLIPENFVFRSGIKYDLGLSSEVTNSGPFKVINNLAGGGAMLDAIIKAAKSKNSIDKFTFSERVDRFRNVPYVKDVDNSCIDSLTFKFQFGQFGLFSCEQEVVLPILKLASLFSYSFTGYDFKNENQGGNDYSGNGNNWIKAPFEPKFNVMSKMYISLFNSGRPLISNLLSENRNENGETQNPAIKSLSQVPKLFSSIVNEAAGQARVTAFLFSIGSSIYGPFFASDIKWEFDYERTDSNGLPFAGTINFSGIKPLLVEDNIGLLSTGGQIIGG